MAAAPKYGDALFEQAKGYIEGGYMSLDLIPTKAALALELGVSRMAMNKWERDPTKPEWSDLMDRLMATQERRLLNGGLGKEFDSAVARRMLSNHGYTEKAAIDHSSSDGSMTQQTVVVLPPKDAD